MIDIIGGFIFSAILLSIWSMLYKENPFFKIVSYLSIGLMLSIALKGGIDSLIKDVFKPALLEGNIPRFAVLIIGLAMFLRFSKSLYFASKWPLAILAGIGTAIAAKGAVSTMILSQVASGSFIGSNLVTNVNNIIIWAGTISVLVYFLFSFKHGPIVSKVSTLGQVYMMLAFGVTFGMYIYRYNVITEITYLAAYPGYYASAIAILILIADIVRSKRKSKLS